MKTPRSQARVCVQGWPTAPLKTIVFEGPPPSGGQVYVAGARNPGAVAMAKVVNPEPESTTLNTEMEVPTLEPATEQEQPLPESTSNQESSKAVEISALDA